MARMMLDAREIYDTETPLEKLARAVVVRAYKDYIGEIGGSYRPLALYENPLDLQAEARDFFLGTRIIAWCSLIGGDGYKFKAGFEHEERALKLT